MCPRTLGCRSTTLGSSPRLFYHRHQIPAREGIVASDQHKQQDGMPLYTPCPIERAPFSCGLAAGGTTHTGRYGGTMIVVCNLANNEGVPWFGDSYRYQVMRAKGPD